ncbi:MAG: hypothetical protein OEZ39_06430 [Gammaproteobacteria bacterium]|nr:hypothetical protein [Gammaproteobacteria bacterium]
MSGLVLLLTACLGGGGGGGGPAPANYDGLTSQAALTGTNAQDFAETSIDGASPSGNLAAGAEGGSTTNNTGQMAGFLRTFIQLSPVLEELRINGGTGSSGSPYNSAIQTSGSTTDSPCGGSMSFSMSIDDVTFDWSGYISFSNFKDCDSGSVTNGSLSFSGNLTSTTYTFNAMSITEGSESFVLTGTMVMTGMPGATGSSFSMTMNMDFRDNNANETYRMRNMVIAMTVGTTDTTMTMTGDIYHPTYGFVTVATTTPITIPNSGNLPTSGVMTLTGSGGSTTTVTYQNDGTYDLAIDTNGDTTVDITKTCTWSTQTCTP